MSESEIITDKRMSCSSYASIAHTALPAEKRGEKKGTFCYLFPQNQRFHQFMTRSGHMDSFKGFEWFYISFIPLFDWRKAERQKCGRGSQRSEYKCRFDLIETETQNNDNARWRRQEQEMENSLSPPKRKPGYTKATGWISEALVWNRLQVPLWSLLLSMSMSMSMSLWHSRYVCDHNTLIFLWY